MKTLSTSFRQRVLGWVLLVLLLLLVKASQAQPAGCTGSDPGGQPATNGLYAEYFRGYFQDNQAFFNDTQNPPGLRRIDAQVNFPSAASWGNLQSTAGGGTVDDADDYSLRLRGSLRIATAGTYTFYLTSDDAAYLWLDGEALAITPTTASALIDNGGNHEVTTEMVTVVLTAGLHNVLIHYGDDCCDNVLVLEYEGPGINRQVVPSGVLCTAQQPGPLSPRALTYTPASQTLTSGSSVTSAVPVADNGGAAITGFSLANTPPLPAGITINSSTGALTVAASVPTGTYAIDVAATNANGTTIFRNAYQFQVTPVPPAGCRGVNPDGTLATAGLFAQYYAGYFGSDLTFFDRTPVGLSRSENQLNFDEGSWGDLTSVASGTAQNPDGFSARFRGRISIATAGTYTFHLSSDDGSLLWLDAAALAASPTADNALIDNRGSHPVETVSRSIFLTAGLHDILVIYGDDMAFNVLKLEYESADAGIARQVVPIATLCTTNSSAPLPVVLTRFTTETVAAGIKTTWETAQEANSDYFVVERSANGKVFEAVERRKAAGTTTQRQAYTLTDRAPLAGASYYRLRQVDLDGTVHFSSVVAAKWKGSSMQKPTATIFPNPTSGNFTVQVQQPTEQPVQLELLDMQGRVLRRETISAQAAKAYSMQPSRLPAGLYIVRLTTSTGRITERLAVE